MHLEEGAEETAVARTSDKNAGDLVYLDDDEEPEFHARTFIALAALFLLNLVQVFALTGPPAIASSVPPHRH